MKRAALLLSLLLANLLAPAKVSALTRGISISPATQRVEISDNQSSQQLTIMATNSTEAEAQLTFSAHDFGALTETGGLFFLGESADTPWQSHRLSSWIDLSPATATLQPGQQQPITVTIRNNQSLGPGGHYAAVVAKLSSDSRQPLAINQAISSLLFVNKQGGGGAELELERFKTSPTWLQPPQTIQLRFRNTGNTHLAPRGILRLTDPFGKVMAKGVVNSASTIMLPMTSHTFTVPMTSLSQPWWPGMYQLTLAYRYDGVDQQQPAHQTVFMLGWVGAGVLLLIVLGAVSYLLRWRMAK